MVALFHYIFDIERFPNFPKMKLSFPGRFLVLLPLLALIALTGCKEPDIKLVNKVKGFEPKWATLNEKMSYLDRNLEQAEKRFEQDFKEIEGALDGIADSLKGRNYRKMLDDYTTIITDRDTMRTLWTSNKEAYTKEVDVFNEWEKTVMDGDVEADEGLKRLDTFKKFQKRLETQADSMTTALEGMYDKHNKILRELSRMMEIFTNYDIKMQ